MNNFDYFTSFIWNFYRNNKRNFAWRNTNNPYHILVSEVMLQQTQTFRVEKKYEEFITTFPSFETLTQATLRDVLSVWQGLGYYRRAQYLHKLAGIIMQKYNGILPDEPKVLETLPGIGIATASSICAFAYNKPTVFIETNIRSVFIDTFFQNKGAISDKELLPLIAQTVDQYNPREWYYALMDYGVWLKASGSNPNHKSLHYAKQSRFEGSDRQIRAKILKFITEQKIVTHDSIIAMVGSDKIRIEKIINNLIKESFIKKNLNGVYLIV